MHLWIKRQKRRLEADPRNALAWSSLARRYTALGQFEHADRAIRLALALAPDSRYVCRGAARFYVHVHQADRAFVLFGESSRVGSDPWLHTRPGCRSGVSPMPAFRVCVRRAECLKMDRSRDIEHAELAAELATIELVGGSDRKSRKLFDRSLDAPTGNSLAQAEWASHRLPSLLDRVARTAAPFDAEARAQRAAQAGSWEAALARPPRLAVGPTFRRQSSRCRLVYCIGWFGGLGSGAAVHRDRATSQTGTASTSEQSGLRPSQSRTTRPGTTALTLAPVDGGGGGSDVTLPATRGLLAFRRGGDPERGRALYLRSIELARQNGDTDAEAMAVAMLLRTEAYAGDRRTRCVGAPLEEQLAGSVRERGVAECVAKAVENRAHFDSLGA